MPNISDSEIKKIANLASLKLNEADIIKFSNDLSSILKLIDEVRNYNTVDVVEPMSHPLDILQRLREDEITEKQNNNILQDIAPKTKSGLYLVPKVVE